MEKRYTIQALLTGKPCTLPQVVRPVKGDYEVPGLTELPCEDFLLEEVRNVQLVQIRVLPFADEAAAIVEKGEDFVRSRRQYINQKFLLPTMYLGRLKFVPKPRKRERFASVAQIIEAPTRYIRFEETVTSSEFGNISSLYIPAKTVLEVEAIFPSKKKENERHLICKSAREKYAFKESSLINATYIQDPQNYTLADVQNFALYPVCVQFEPISPYEVSFYDDDDALMMHTIAAGPLEIRKFTCANLTVAWFEEKTEHSRIVIIPKSICAKTEVSILGAVSKCKANTIERYRCGEDERCIRNTLFVIPRSQQNKDKLVWLRRPGTLAMPFSERPPPTPVPRKSKEKPVVAVKPQLPSAKAHNSLELPAVKAKEDRIRKWREKARLGFDKVHQELIRLKRFTTGDKRVEVNTEKKDLNSPTPSTADRPLPKTPKLLPENEELDYEDIDENTETNKQVRNKSKWNLDNVHKEAPRHNEQEYLEIENDVETNSDYIDMQGTSSLADLNKILRRDQTADDFYAYTVNEVVHCFHICSASKMAKICSEQKLDGRFFRKFNIEDLKKEPFQLEPFSVLKVRKVILDGWRPKLSAE